MAFWIVWLVMGIAFILFFSAMVIPKLMLKTYAATLPVRVKALERTSNEYGDTITFSPPSSVRRYIRRYRVGHDENGVFFCGELAAKVAFAEYELTVYGADNDIIRILRIKEKFNGGETTAITRLPDQTDYVTLRLVCIDDSPVPAERRAFNLSYAIWLTVLCLSLVLAVDLMLWLIVTFVLRYMDGFTMALTLPVGTWAALLGFTALAIVFVTCLISLGGFFIRRKGDVDDKR